jgi:UDP-N-acetyl-D-mannosaminuronate dehydrogenase
MKQKVLVVGVGEIGKPLLGIIGQKYEAYGLDVEPTGPLPRCDIMHLCFPYSDPDQFLQESLRYVREYDPSLTIINSTVAPGTTRRVATESGRAVVNSPVRGKHARMSEELLHYTRFIGALTSQAGEQASEHFTRLGMRTRLLSSPEASELAKLTETTYFGLLITWAQEVERYCKAIGVNYDEVVSFYEEISFFPPVKYFPGVIGGHCVMPNIQILKQRFKSDILDAVENSNQLKRRDTGTTEGGA